MKKTMKIFSSIALSLSIIGSSLAFATGIEKVEIPEDAVYGDAAQQPEELQEVITEPVEEPKIESPAANKHEVGDVIGEILSTDIVTYVEGVRVNSYNIKGRTAVIAQDLRSLGAPVNFGVNFDEETRVLTVTNTDIFATGSDVPLKIAPSDTTKPVGTPVGKVLYTDITTNYNGQYIESFNIGGLTCIYADDLGKMCGTYIWDEENRRVNVYRSSSHIPYVTKTDSGRILPAEESVITKSETFNRWAKPASSHVVINSDGTFTALEVGENIDLETYDQSFNRISSFSIKKELPLFGALYQGKDYNYIAYGQENLLEDNSREVIRIVIYDKKFVKISEVSVSNCKTAIPFDASGAQMSENDRYLVLHTSRSQYADENGNRPQTQLTVIVDKHTWQVCNILGKYQYNHTSHALQEFVRFDGDKIVTANYSDAAPLRGAFVQELDCYGKVISTHGLYNVAGPWTTSFTGGMIGGLEISDKGYLVPISTVDPFILEEHFNVGADIMGIETRDIYLMWINKETSELRHTCLARYTGTGLTGSVPYIVKLEDGNFMILWQRFGSGTEESEDVSYAFVDSEGNQIGKTHTVKAQLSESCTPVVFGGKVIWYVNTENGRQFYGLNCQVPSVKEEPYVPETDDTNTNDSTEDEAKTEEAPKNENLKDDEINLDEENSEDDLEDNIITEVEGI